MSSSSAAYSKDQEGTVWSPFASTRDQSGRVSLRIQSRPSISNLLGGPHAFGGQAPTKYDDCAEGLSSFGATSLSPGRDEGDDYLQSLITDNEVEQIRIQGESALNRLQSTYVFEDPNKLSAFLEDYPSVSDLLLVAAPLLKLSFGEGTVLHLQIPPEEDVPVTVYAVALCDGTLEDARIALHRFDDLWITDANQKGSGRVVFDYQLV